MKFIALGLLAAFIVGCSTNSNSGSAPSDSTHTSSTPSTSNTTNNPTERLHNPQTGELKN